MTAQSFIVCAPAPQKTWRDLAHLDHLADGVDWLDPAELAGSSRPAVICGLDAHQAPDALGSLLKQRSAAGFSSILVPRFKSGDLKRVLGSPAPVHIKSGEAKFLTWQDGDRFDLPVFAVASSVMTAHRWAVTEAGCCVLAWRPVSANGPIVLCTASVAGPSLGVNRDDQQRLLARIVKDATAMQPVIQQTAPSVPEVASTDLDGFLSTGGGDAAALLMALYAAGGHGESDLPRLAENFLGVRLRPDLLERVSDFTDESQSDIADALVRHGWRAHLRRIDHLLKEDNTP